MKKIRTSHEMTRLNGAAFRIGAEAVRSGGLELLLEATLSEVFGGDTIVGTCTEFTCNVYAPPPPPLGG
ncbi:MAG: hypothetical protein QOF89_288 [Acidobacteriota bacterium]|jgi:hypothetical protein|nr:hypothetical protein [Acidobacteriota bacterium]